MDLLIKNMYMPTDDVLRIEIYPDGQVRRIVGWAISEKRDSTAVEVPPHGDLCDKKLIHDKMVENIHIANEEDFGSDKAKQNVTMAFKAVLYELENEIPTVLEASK